MIDLNEFAKEVHANAVAHGWYDKGERTEAEIFANIHSEWSEAFDAYAHGLPWYYHKCTDTATPGVICESAEDCYVRKIGKSPDMCFIKDAKPEGIAVELIDGVIRILDFVGYYNSRHDKGEKIIIKKPPEGIIDLDICKIICKLHSNTADAWYYMLGEKIIDTVNKLLNWNIETVFLTISRHGLDPEAIMLEKHEYNKTRPYRHGGKVV